MKKKLAEIISDKYNNSELTTDKELLYLYHLYNIYEIIGRKLPYIQMNSYYSCMKMYSIRTTLQNRKIEDLDLYNIDLKCSLNFTKNFEINKE